MPRKYLFRITYLAILCACLLAARPRTSANASSQMNAAVATAQQANAPSHWKTLVEQASREISCAIEVDRSPIDGACEQDWLIPSTPEAISAELDQCFVAMLETTSFAIRFDETLRVRNIGAELDRQSNAILAAVANPPIVGDTAAFCQATIAWPVQKIVAETPIDQVDWTPHMPSIRKPIPTQYKCYWDMSREEVERDWTSRFMKMYWRIPYLERIGNSSSFVGRTGDEFLD